MNPKFVFVAINLAAASSAINSANPAQDYFNCIAVNAGNLESSGESPQDIAIAAQAICETFLADAAAFMVVDFESRPEMKKYRAQYPVSAAELQEAHQSAIRALLEGGKSLAIRVVIEKRAEASQKKENNAPNN